MRTLLLLLAIAFAVPCPAQFTTKPAEKSVKGTFYVSIDDVMTLFVNGKEVFHGGLGEHRSPEIELKTGDRVLVRMANDHGGPRRFKLLFASTDGETIVSFRSRDYKIVPDVGVSDFAPEQFQKWTKYPKQDHMKELLPIKSYSDWVWGDLQKCILASVVTPQMISGRPK